MLRLALSETVSHKTTLALPTDVTTRMASRRRVRLTHVRRRSKMGAATPVHCGRKAGHPLGRTIACRGLRAASSLITAN